MKDLSNVIFITDMDGTLLPSNKRLNQKDLDAIADFRKFGGRFTVATGRTVQSASQYFAELQLDEPIIVLNGGAVYNCSDEEYVWQKFVDCSAYDAVKEILEKFPKVGAEIDLSDEILVPQYSIQEEYHIDISYKDLTPRYVDIKDVSPEGWCKVLFAADKDEIDKLAKFTESRGWNDLAFVRSSKYFYEIIPNGCSKGSALGKMRELFHLCGCTVAACGDFDNDIEMLKNSDIPIAPANALSEVKKTACMVTKENCDNGAVAEALYYVMNVL